MKLNTSFNDLNVPREQSIKQVYHLIYEQQAFYNGEPIGFNNLDLWDKFKVTFGFNVTEKNKPNGKKNSILSINEFSPIIRETRVMKK
ncbi:hypothetical protein FNI64_22200 [Salmonella enterica subsp. salamae]|nr:hypothetical protein [Salmonella enterica subsp. salamae]